MYCFFDLGLGINPVREVRDGETSLCLKPLCSVLVDFVLGDEEGAEGGVYCEMEGCDKSTAEKV